jgi:hypothetical protein
LPNTKSKYDIEERRDGFVVRADERQTVFVDLTETGFRVETEQRWRQRHLFHDSYIRPRMHDEAVDRFGLYEYRRLCHRVCCNLMSCWQQQKSRSAPFNVTLWAQKQTKKALGRRIHHQWKRLIRKIDPQIRGVQRAVFASTFRAPALLHEPSLYRQKLLVRDILQYPAAAHLVEIVSQYRVHPFPNLPYSVECLTELDNWQNAYSFEGKRYRSLSRTLMNLPGAIPSGILATLRRVHLERPVTDRVELITFLLAVQAGFPRGLQQDRRRLFQHVQRNEILTAMHLMSQATGAKLTPRRTSDIHTFVSNILDYPGPVTGRLIDFTRRSINWHANVAECGADDLDDLEVVAVPPINLPSRAEIQFLATVGDIRSEGEHMQHCVASYAEKAVNGGCYLFHVEHEGTTATVEVSPDGRVRQSCGLMNTTNAATEFGRNALRQWGASLQFHEVTDDMYSWMSSS